MAKTKAINGYEQARKQRLEENQKRLQELGILDISKSLSAATSPKKKPKQRILKPKPHNAEDFEPRRSTRARNPVASYNDKLDINFSPRKRSRSSSNSTSWARYIAIPEEEAVFATLEEQGRARQAAEEFQSSIQSGHPSCIKSMVRSHVYSCFWLGLPTDFCTHLPKKNIDMILEDEAGQEFHAKYLGQKRGLSGGWKGFALHHKLNHGDSVVFELAEPERLKVYIFRAFASLKTPVSEDIAKGSAGEAGEPKCDLNLSQNSVKKTEKKRRKKANIVQETTGIEKSGNSEKMKVQCQLKKGDAKNKLANMKKPGAEDKQNCPLKPRKKPEARLFRRKSSM